MEELTMARDCNDKSEERPYAIESNEKEGRYKLLIDLVQVSLNYALDAFLLFTTQSVIHFLRCADHFVPESLFCTFLGKQKLVFQALKNVTRVGNSLSSAVERRKGTQNCTMYRPRPRL